MLVGGVLQPSASQEPDSLIENQLPCAGRAERCARQLPLPCVFKMLGVLWGVALLSLSLLGVSVSPSLLVSVVRSLSRLHLGPLRAKDGCCTVGKDGCRGCCLPLSQAERAARETADTLLAGGDAGLTFAECACACMRRRIWWRRARGHWLMMDFLDVPAGGVEAWAAYELHLAWFLVSGCGHYFYCRCLRWVYAHTGCSSVCGVDSKCLP